MPSASEKEVARIVKRVEALLNAFVPPPKKDQPKVASRVVFVDHAAIIAWSGNKFTLVVPNDTFHSGANLQGCIDGKWNIRVYRAVDGLVALNLLSKEDARIYLQYLNQHAKQEHHAHQVKQLHVAAAQLGYTVVKNEENTDAAEETNARTT